MSAPAATGWTLLTDFDARGLSQNKPSADKRLVYRPSTGASFPGGRAVDESLTNLFAFKKEITNELGDVVTNWVWVTQTETRYRSGGPGLFCSAKHLFGRTRKQP